MPGWMTQHEHADACARRPHRRGVDGDQSQGAVHLCRSGFGDRIVGDRHAGRVGSPKLWYVAVAGSTVALPILGYAVSGERLDPTLSRLKDWMERQHATLVAAILVVIGLLVLYKGIHGL